MTVKTIAPHSPKLPDLKTRFNLQKAETADFFVKWRDRSVGLTEADHGALDRLNRSSRLRKRFLKLSLICWQILGAIVRVLDLS